MSAHRYKIGSVVTLASQGMGESANTSYVVEALLPPLGSVLQYRIKSEAEGFRRVVVEHLLSDVGAPPAPQAAPERLTHPGEAD